MTSSSYSPGRTNSQDFSRDSENEGLFTVNGYIKRFETCESKADMFNNFSKFDLQNVDEWKRCIPQNLTSSSVDALFSFWDKNLERSSTKSTDELIKISELFSLLENVFRNALLRPYIPAYRTINKNCGRYRFSESEAAERLFRSLKFDDRSKGLLTYEEQNPNETVVLALTCFVFWHLLSTRMKGRF